MVLNIGTIVTLNIMITISKKSKTSNIIYLNSDEDFRDDIVTIPKNYGNIIPLNGTYLNPYIYYEVITKQLVSGTHNFAVKSVDNLNNESLLSESSIELGEPVLPPRFLLISASNNTVTLNWEHSVNGAPDFYTIFYSDISTFYDKNMPDSFPSIDGSLTTYSLNLPDGSYRFTVDAVVGGTYSNNYITAITTLPSSDIVPPKVVNATSLTDIGVGQFQVFAQNVSVGRLNVQFYWFFNFRANRFRIYYDNMTGTIDYSNPIEFDRQITFLQKFTTQQIAFNKKDAIMKFVIRAVSPDGIEDGNTFEHEVLMEGDAPDTPNILSTTNVTS